MIVVLLFATVFAGGFLFLTGWNRIIAHDASSVGVLVRCASGFILVFAAIGTGIGVLAL